MASRQTRLPLRIDGETVMGVFTRMTVGELGEAEAVAFPRGASPSDSAVATRAHLLDRFVSLPDVTVDDAPTTVAAAFGARADVLIGLFLTLLAAQKPNAQETADLAVAMRFSVWLANARAEKSSSPWAETGTSCVECRREQLCAKRGCDGTVKKRVVWHDKGVVLKQCPILSFTPLIETTIRRYYLAHEVSAATGRRELRHLPRPGGLDDQESWELDAFRVLRAVEAQIAQETAAV